MSVYARERLAVRLGLCQLTVTSFATNHSCAFPSQREWPLVSSPHHLGSGVLALDGVHLHPPAFTVPFLGSDTVLTDSLSRPHQLPHPEWSIHMTVFLFLRRLWPVQMVSLPPWPLIVVRFTSPLSGIRSQQARTRFSSLGQPSGFRVPSDGCHPRLIAKLRASTGTELTLVTLH